MGDGREVVREAEIRKGLADLVDELLQSLLVIRDARDGLRSGLRHHALALSGQIRALLLEKRRDAHPLLLSVLEQIGLNATLYTMSGAGENLPPGLDDPVFHMAALPFTLTRELPGQSVIALADLGTLNLLKFEGRTYSVEEVVKFLANRAGGAHYSRAVPEGLARLLATAIPEFVSMRDLVLNALSQIGQAVFEVGLESVRQLSDIDLFMDVGLPVAEPGMFVYDARYPNGRMRISLFIGGDRHLHARVFGIGGYEMTVRAPTWIDWSDPHLIHLQVRHNDRLGCVLSLSLDGGTPARAEIDVPIFLYSDVNEYDSTLNAPVEAELNTPLTSLVLSQMAAIGYSPPVDVGRVNAMFHDRAADPDRGVLHYHLGSSGRSPAGQRDITLVGNVTKSQMAEAMVAPQE